MRITLFLLALLAVWGPAQASAAPRASGADAPGAGPSSADALKNRSGLPVPRFASLRAERAYMRAGPGKEYPVVWVFVRPGVPLEVTAEWNIWRRVRDAEGAEGWMDRAMLSTTRTFQVRGGVRRLHARPDLSSPTVWQAEPGVSARITLCENRWCRIETGGRAGYILREHGFGTYPDEPVAP
jgi:SH3-like domain-containing protein